jgi:glucose/arabinose dehydrogenase
VRTNLRAALSRYSRAVYAAGCACLLLAACGSAGSAGSAGRVDGAKAVAGAASTVATNGPVAGARTAKASSGLRLVKLGVFRLPTYAAGPPGDPHRLFVVEKAGRIILLVRGHRESQPFLDISSLVGSSGNEQGLLSMAFEPDYARSGRFYVYYTDTAGDVRVVEYDRSAQNPNVANAGSAKLVLAVSHHRFFNHNGGQLQFGPDHDLYVGVGDGGSENDPLNRGQNTDVLLGKLLRISPKLSGGYSIPGGNPFAGTSGRRPEIWAYGLRNPWRFSFDRRTGDLVIGDVGQDQQEEVDFALRGTGAGANYGWSIWEGTRREKPGRAPNAVFPVLVKPHTQAYCAIIGGYVVRDRGLGSLYGRYLYGDNCKAQISSVKLTRGHATGDRFTGLSVAELSAFGQDTLGRIYAVSLAGPVYRITVR